MWGLNAGLAWLFASTQLPLDLPATESALRAFRARPDFKLIEGEHVLSPKTMLELPRPGNGMANEAGDLSLVPVTQHTLGKTQ